MSLFKIYSGAEKKSQNVEKLANDCLQDLDISNDGRVNKDEFINGLLSNYQLRALMSPFN